ncbi:MAG: hypothetical protein IPH45_04380 [Bacteroidales bacterium]|nr:hypothetical protein [Bacteroidales bacterium]
MGHYTLESKLVQSGGLGKETGGTLDQTLQLRRYGGDLQGVIDKLGYLEELGINAIYLNPINDAPPS